MPYLFHLLTTSHMCSRAAPRGVASCPSTRRGDGCILLQLSYHSREQRKDLYKCDNPQRLCNNGTYTLTIAYWISLIQDLSKPDLRTTVTRIKGKNWVNSKNNLDLNSDCVVLFGAGYEHVGLVNMYKQDQKLIMKNITAIASLIYVINILKFSTNKRMDWLTRNNTPCTLAGRSCLPKSISPGQRYPRQHWSCFWGGSAPDVFSCWVFTHML